MKSNASLKIIGQKLNEAKSVLVFPHVSPDGDALGSAVAICRAMRAEGKESYVILDEEVPSYIAFVNHECCSMKQDLIQNPDVTLCVDCSEDNRIPERVELYNSGKVKLCIDHHINEIGYGDFYYIDESAAAASELIYTIIHEMNWKIDEETAKALYVGIVTDTGGFQYSNTTPNTHRIAADLIELGVNVNDVSVELFQNVEPVRVLTETRIMENVEFFAGGKAGIGYVTKAMLDELGATTDDTEGVINIIRNIKGVEIAAFLKEKNDAIKVSLRAKTDGDVQQIATMFEGGGHKKAAGCTLYKDMQEAVELMKKEISKSLEM